MRSIITLVVKRLGLGAVTMIVISVLIFLGVEALPGDLATAILGQEATPETVAQFRKELKLDEPPVKRYFLWLGDFLRGDLGKSLANKRPVAELIIWRFKNTIFLATSAAVVVKLVVTSEKPPFGGVTSDCVALARMTLSTRSCTE